MNQTYLSALSAKGETAPAPLETASVDTSSMLKTLKLSDTASLSELLQVKQIAPVAIVDTNNVDSLTAWGIASFELSSLYDKAQDKKDVNDLYIAVSTSDNTGEHSFYPDRILYPMDYERREAKRNGDYYKKTGKSNPVALSSMDKCKKSYVTVFDDEYLFTTGSVGVLG